MLRNLVTSLLEHEQVKTTDARAKEVRRLAERMITLGKRGTLHARRQALETLRSKAVATKLFDILADRYDSRRGGYTRIVKLGRRSGDDAPREIIQLIPEDEEVGTGPGSASGSGSKSGTGADASEASR
jgi:large subunit ribosomal protein L17